MENRNANPERYDPQESLSLAGSINRFLSPDHAIGQTLLAWRMRLQLLAWRPVSKEDRALHAVISRLAPAYTMVDLPRLRRLASHAEQIHRDGIAGAVVECGTWRGGSLALIDWVFRRRGESRVLWAFDSFEGLPPPGNRDPRSARSGFFRGWCAATEADVHRALASVASTSELHVVPGWLADTLHHAETGPIGFLNLDVDWYDSVRTALLALYDRVTRGGIVNFDDYGRWHGCDEAVHDFLRDRALSLKLIQTGRQGAWLRKP